MRSRNVIDPKSHMCCILFPKCYGFTWKDPLIFFSDGSVSWNFSPGSHQICLSIQPSIHLSNY